MEKSDDSEKEQYMTSKASSAHDGDLEDKESSKDRNFTLEQHVTDTYNTPLNEESEEEEKSTFGSRTVFSHVGQPSESEREQTPDPDQVPDYMVPRLRENTLKVSNVLKRNPKSVLFYPRNYNEVRVQIQNAKPRINQRLHDYGDPTQASTVNNGRGNRRPEPGYIRSLEELPPNSFQDNAYNDLIMSTNGDENPLSNNPISKPYSTKDSLKDSNRDSWQRLPSFSKLAVDWAESPIYEEYNDKGVTRYNDDDHQGFVNEDEAPKLFALLKMRYSNATSIKSIEPFFHKAMDTLGKLLGSFSHHHLFRAVQQMYNKVDAANTLKLILRVRTMFDARYLL